MKFPILCALLTLAGCATCREHPIACTIAGGIVATSIAISVNQPDHYVRPVPLCAPYCAVGR